MRDGRTDGQKNAGRKSTRAHQRMRYPNVTWRISSYMITYLPLYHTPVLPVRNIFLSKVHVLRIMDVGLLFTFCTCVSSINYYLVCSLQIHKICALCGIFSAISVFLLVINCTREAVSCTIREVYSLRQVQNRCILLPLLRLTPPVRGSPWMVSVTFYTEVIRWLRYTAVKKYCRLLQPLSRVHQRYVIIRVNSDRRLQFRVCRLSVVCWRKTAKISRGTRHLCSTFSCDSLAWNRNLP